tara:strand:+ start:30279 stop:31013 length:735 start_codon:yes stop_codon:yes gene_type:complete
MNLFSLGVTKYGNRDFTGETAGKREMGLNSEAVVYGWLSDGAVPKVHLLYYDRAQSASPIVVETDETALSAIDGYSNQLEQMTVNAKNGVTYTTATEMIVNLDRFILAYEDGAGSEKFAIWYDKSRTNKAQIDSSHVDFVEVAELLGSIKTQFIMHLGGKGSLLDLEQINVNGRIVDFPDQTASGLIRNVNISTVEEDSNDSIGGTTSSKSHITMSGLGQGWQRVIVNHTLTALVGKNEIALTT